MRLRPGGKLALALAAAAAPSSLPAAPPGPPVVLGQCGFTTVKSVTQQLEDASTHQVIAGSGSAVVLANGGYGVSYDQLPAVNRSHVGDRVMTCLARLPTGCPPGDRRGKWYTTTNLRTNEAWMLPDSEHGCGGA